MNSCEFLSLLAMALDEYANVNFDSDGIVKVFNGDYAASIIYARFKGNLPLIVSEALDDPFIMLAVQSSIQQDRHWITSGEICGFDFTLTISGNQANTNFYAGRKHA